MQNITFNKNDEFSFYEVIKGGEAVAVIDIQHNWYDNSDCYIIDDKTFKYLKDAKAYARENY